MTRAGSPTDLLQAVVALRDRVAATVLPLEVAGVEDARRARREIVGQLDDYVLPRIKRLDAPLLAVVGGSTGAGKSTLVNSLVGREVSAPGVLRPTTRSPVLVCHPDDLKWFVDRRILPGMARSHGAAPGHRSLHLVRSEVIGPGLALLDAPDIDSVVRENRELAGQLLAAADLWLFVTTAARYADAVPWGLLRTAQQRSAALAVVLDRVPPGADEEVSGDLAGMLEKNGLGETPLFIIGETELQEGRLADEVIAPIRGWLADLTKDAERRYAVMRQTLEGALNSLQSRVPVLADAADAQTQALVTLRDAATNAYAAATHDVDDAMKDGSLLRGEVLARWQEFVGTGEILRSLEAQIGRMRDRLSAAVRGRTQPGTELRVALESGVESLVRSAADTAAERTAAIWRANPAGAALVAKAETDISRASDELAANIEVAVRSWQSHVLDLVRSTGAEKRGTARFLSYGVNGAGLLVMLLVFAHTGGLTGAEAGVAGGTSLLSQKILEAVFGDQAVRQLASDARKDLRRRVDELLAEESARYLTLLDAEGVAGVAGAEVSQALAALADARKKNPDVLAAPPKDDEDDEDGQAAKKAAPKRGLLKKPQLKKGAE